MTKFTPPESWREVLKVMEAYCLDKRFDIRKVDLELISESFFQYYEGIGWMSGRQAIRFWPAVAKRWLLQEVRRGIKPAVLPIKSDSVDRIDASRQHRDKLRNQIRRQTDGQSDIPHKGGSD